MNGVRCIDRSREFLISSNRSVFYPPFISRITFCDMCLALVLFLIAGHKGPTGVHVQKEEEPGQSHRCAYIALLYRAEKKKQVEKGIKI
jgi:hypothetical protein